MTEHKMHTLTAHRNRTHYLGLMLRMFVLSLLAIQTTRVAMLLIYPDYFIDTSFLSILRAMLYGVRFDMATVVILGSLFWLILLIPLQFLQRPWLRQGIAGLYGLLLLFILTLCMGDLYYFGEVNRHVGQELLNIGNDLGAIGQIVLQGVKLFTAVSILYLLFVAVLWWRWVVKPAKRLVTVPKGIIKKTTTVLLVLLLAVFFGRGMLIYSKPISIVDAFAMPTPEMANLALNGTFVVMKDISLPAKTPINLLDKKRLAQLDAAYAKQPQPARVQALLSQKDDLFSPLLIWQKQFFKRQEPLRPAKNIVLLLLESWDYQSIDALGKNNYQATPFMDKLIARSQVWDHFYAAGQRSILGIQAIFTSIPILHNQPVLGYGLEMNRLSQLGHIAKAQGYNTLFMQTSEGRSFHLDGIAKLLGFEQFYGKEDIPLIKTYPDNNAPPYGWDYDSLMFLHKKIDKTVQKNPKQRFLATLFTGTTHIPFADPGAEFHVREHDKSNFDGYLNTLRYSDWSIEQFMTAAEKSSWYQDTVFIFLADHIYRATDKELKDLFHIPLIIFTPDGSLPPMRHQNIASQYDMLPTLLDLIQSPQAIASFGRSLFDDIDTRPPYVVVSQGSLYGVIGHHGWASFSGQKDVQQSTSPTFDKKQADAYRQEARWRLQHIDKALNENRWLPNALQIKPK